jgi:uncharacterized pyridoxal phosphate-containing UPF0001 family protein
MLRKKDHNPSEREFQNFINMVSKLEAIEFLGLVNIFNIELFKKDKEKSPKTFEEIFSELMDRYIKASPLQRKNVTKILKAAVDKKA